MNASNRLMLLLLTTSLLMGAATGNTLYYQLALLWALVYLGSWAWAFSALRELRLDRSARTLRSQVGHIFEERFELYNPTRMPRLWVDVRDESSLPGSEGSRVLTLLQPRQARSYLARTRLLQRGVFPLGQTRLISGDLFGLFPVSRIIPAKDTLLVYPMMVDAQYLPNPPGLLPGGEALRRRTHQVTSNAVGVREYMHGDALSRIHWLSSARRDHLMVKEFELDPLADVWIFLDADRRTQARLDNKSQAGSWVDFWSRDFKVQLPPSTEEYGVSAAASLARAYLRLGRSVGFAVAGQLSNVLPPDRSGRQLGKILEALALLKANGNVPLRALVETQVRHMARGSTIVLVTASVEAEIVILVDFLLRRGLRPVMIFIQADTFGGAPGTEAIAAQITAFGVPVRRVKCDQDLAEALSLAWMPAKK